MPRSAKRDNTETMARNFDDERSFVSLEGHEYLYGADWKRRKRFAFERDSYKCRYVTDDTFLDHIKRCGAPAEHIHHMLRKSNGGSDDIGNLMSICALHHKIVHPEKQLRWTRRKHDSSMPKL